MKIELFLENTLMSLLREKTIDSIHVKDIIAELGICKGTFYKYYQDKYDLVVHVFEHKFYHGLDEVTSWEEFVLGSLAAFRKAPEVVYNAFLSDDINSIAHHHAMKIKRLFLENRAEKDLPAEGQEIEYAVDILAWLINKIAMAWLKDGCIETEEEVLMTVKRLMPNNICEP